MTNNASINGIKNTLDSLLIILISLILFKLVLQSFVVTLLLLKLTMVSIIVIPLQLEFYDNPI